MIDTKALRGAIYKAYKSQSQLSDDIGWAKNKIGRILNGTSIPSIEDCHVLMDKLNLSDREYKQIFLPSLSPNGDMRVMDAATSYENIRDSESEINQRRE
jgi:transcriptional regulator with XRE-family HTH domain